MHQFRVHSCAGRAVTGSVGASVVDLPEVNFVIVPHGWSVFNSRGMVAGVIQHLLQAS